VNRLIIIGAGGFGNEALWVARASGEWEVAGFADDDPALGSATHGLPVLGGAELICRTSEPGWFHCAVGNNAARGRVFEQFVACGWRPATLIHPSVIIAPNVHVGAGSYVGAGSILCPNAVIGSRSALINCHVTVGHDSRMGDFSQACPGVRISGSCIVGDFAFLGSNASVLPGMSIGARATVGANSVVVMRVGEGLTVVGVPALRL
jgi:sugar O-acyltransferase (sialic acid O-acetyltransferase NeuD family)